VSADRSHILQTAGTPFPRYCGFFGMPRGRRTDYGTPRIASIRLSISESDVGASLHETRVIELQRYEANASAGPKAGRLLTRLHHSSYRDLNAIVRATARLGGFFLQEIGRVMPFMATVLRWVFHTDPPL